MKIPVAFLAFFVKINRQDQPQAAEEVSADRISQPMFARIYARNANQRNHFAIDEKGDGAHPGVFGKHKRQEPQKANDRDIRLDVAGRKTQFAIIE
jgi:hypothetical protein